MFRPKITTEMRDHRVSGAKNCLRNVDNYVNSVVYSDTQNFGYDEKGNISLNFGLERESSNTVMVWGSISSSSPMASSCRVTVKFDSSKYKDILEKHVIPLSTNIPSTNIGLVHDWYQVHRSKAVVEFLSQHNSIFVLEWPRYFGDVMPLEPVWLQIMVELTAGNVEASNSDTLWREVSVMWRKVCSDVFIKKLLEEMQLKLNNIISDGFIYVD